MRIEKGFADSERPTVAALYWEAFGAKLGRALGPRDRAIAFLTANLDPRHAICARDAEGRLVGVAGFRTREGALVSGGLAEMARVYGLFGALWRGGLLALLVRDTENRRFIMDGLFVAAEAQGRGTGTALLAAIAEEARRRGYAEIRLEVIAENPRARSLYEREGFRPVGTTSTGLLRLIFGFSAATTMVRSLV